MAPAWPLILLQRLGCAELHRCGLSGGHPRAHRATPIPRGPRAARMLSSSGAAFGGAEWGWLLALLPPHFLRHVPEVPHAQVSPQLNPLCKHTPIPAPHAPSLPQRDAVAQVPVSACYGNAAHTPAPLPHNLCDSLPTLGAVADDSAPWLWDEPWREGATHRSTLMCVGIPGASRTGRLGATLLGMPTGLWVSQCVIPVGNLPGVAPPGP